MAQKDYYRRMYDLCRNHLGDHIDSSISRLEGDNFANERLPWDLDGFVVHIDTQCWEIKRIRKYDQGQPSGFEYHFEPQYPEDIEFDSALTLIRQRLNLDTT